MPARSPLTASNANSEHLRSQLGTSVHHTPYHTFTQAPGTQAQVHCAAVLQVPKNLRLHLPHLPRHWSCRASWAVVPALLPSGRLIPTGMCCCVQPVCWCCAVIVFRASVTQCCEAIAVECRLLPAVAVAYTARPHLLPTQCLLLASAVQHL